MKQVIFDEQSPNGRIVEVDDIPTEETPAENKDAIKVFFEGLASADTNSIAKIRELAKQFLTDTE